MFRLVASVVVVVCVVLAWYISSDSDEAPANESTTEQSQTIQPAGQAIPVPANPGGFGSTKFN